MATKTGILTINGIQAIECDSDPSVGGLSALIGSYASATDGSGVFYKSALSDTSWVKLATQVYVDNLITGLNWKKSVLYSTNSGEDLSLTGLTAAIDGSLRFLSPTDRILVKNQSTQSLNGIYNPSSGAWTRVVDADSDSEILAATVYVREGSVEKDRVYAVNVSPITLGTTAITFALISGAGAYTYGSYLKLTGNVFDIDFTTFSTNEISEGSKLFFTDARVLTAPLTGFASAAGTITAADTILSAINKLNGNLDSKTLFKSTTDSSTHTGTLTNTIIWSEDISNKLSSGDIADLISDVVRVSGSTSASIRYYLNSSASLSGATQIGLYTYGFSGLNIADFRRELIVKSSTVIRVKGSVSGPLNDLSIFSNYADVTVNLASLYVIFAITLGNTGDQFLVSSRKMVR